MTSNVTLRLDDELLRKVRHRAVDDDLSLSVWVARLLERTVAEEESRKAAKPRALRRLHRGYRLGGEPLSREAAHAR